MYISQNMKIGPQNRLFNHNFQPGLNTPPRPTSPGPITGPTRLPCPPFPIPHPTPTAGGRSHERASQTCALFPACLHSYSPNPSGGSRRPSTGGRWRAAAQHWRRGLAAAARSGQHPAAKQAADQRRAVAAGGPQPGSGPSSAGGARAGLGASLGAGRPGSDLPFFPQRF